MLKSQQRFRSKKNNVFSEEVNKVALSFHNDKKCNQLIAKKLINCKPVKIQFAKTKKLNTDI